MTLKLSRQASACGFAACIALASSVAVAQESQQIDIPAQALSSAVVELSDETGMQIIAPGRLVEGKRTGGVRGDMSSLDALSRILTGSGLTYRVVGNGSVVLAQAATDDGSDASVDDAFTADEIIVRPDQHNFWVRNHRSH
ncbi:MAG: STN domain-containing protein [Pseudomonadota bacterium]